jgi:flagellar protein FliL
MAVSAVKKDAATAEGGEAAPPPKKNRVNWKVLVIALVAVAAAGGGAYYALSARGHDAAKEPKAEAEKPPQFMLLDPFTVNLLLEDNPQFLQLALTLKVADAAAIEKIKLYLPEVRDKVLMLLSGQKASTLLTLDGKRTLAIDILNAINAIVVPADKKSRASEKGGVPPKEEDEDEAEAEKKADGEGVAEEGAEAETKPKKRRQAAPPPPELPILSVLFTSFIIQ